MPASDESAAPTPQEQLRELADQLLAMDHEIGKIEHRLGTERFKNQIGPNVLRRHMARLEVQRNELLGRRKNIRARAAQAERGGHGAD